MWVCPKNVCSNAELVMNCWIFGDNPGFGQIHLGYKAVVLELGGLENSPDLYLDTFKSYPKWLLLILLYWVSDLSRITYSKSYQSCVAYGGSCATAG